MRSILYRLYMPFKKNRKQQTKENDDDFVKKMTCDDMLITAKKNIGMLQYSSNNSGLPNIEIHYWKSEVEGMLINFFKQQKSKLEKQIKQYD